MLDKLDFAVELSLQNTGVPAQRARLLADPRTAVLHYLRDLAARCPLPLVVFFDEADCLVGPTMVSFLTQLRDGYMARDEAPFPWSVALIGRRDVRDYLLAEKDRVGVSWLGTASPFNISAEAATIGPFTEPEVAELLNQYTVDTGQRFEPEAAARIYASRSVTRGSSTRSQTRSCMTSRIAASR